MIIQIRLLLLVFAVAVAGSVSAQTLGRTFVGNAGETLTKGNITITYTVGEFTGDLILPAASSGTVLTVGFTQPDEIPLVNTDLSKHLIAFPNPNTTGKMRLSFNGMPNGNYTIEVIDVLGRIMQTTTADYKDHNFSYIDMDISRLKGGIYFISVKGDQNFHGEVKIIKI